MARNDPTIYMRIPQELKDQLDVASETNRRSLTAEVVARLQQSFEPRNDPEWQLRVALHINEARREVLDRHLDLLLAHVGKIENALLNSASIKGRAATEDLQHELKETRAEIARIQLESNILINEGYDLEKAKSDSDREVLELLNKLADGAMQDSLRDLHALGERLGVSEQARGAVMLKPEEKHRVVMPLATGLDAYKDMLEEVLSKRDEQLREWWRREFGYDPKLPQVELTESKGPVKKTSPKK